eukprot:scaffold6196_cov113-Isochrysis_galbana.AAC.1
MARARMQQAAGDEAGVKQELPVAAGNENCYIGEQQCISHRKTGRLRLDCELDGGRRMRRSGGRSSAAQHVLRKTVTRAGRTDLIAPGSPRRRPRGARAPQKSIFGSIRVVEHSLTR